MAQTAEELEILKCGGVVWCGVVWCGVVWCGVVWWRGRLGAKGRGRGEAFSPCPPPTHKQHAMRFKRKHGVRGGRELVGLGGGVSFLTCFGCVLYNAGVFVVVPTEWSSDHSQQCLEHARTHAFGVGRQTQLVAVGWVLFIFVFLCFVACSFCPSFLSLSFFGCPSLFLVLSGLLFAGVFFFDVCLVWLVSFFFVARCPASYKKGGKGEGAVARRLLLRFRLTLGTEGPNRDLRGSRMRLLRPTREQALWPFEEQPRRRTLYGTTHLAWTFPTTRRLNL